MGSKPQLNEVFIVSGVRTPIGSFQGSLAPLSAPQLGTVVLEAAIKQAGIPKDKVQEVLMGHVLQASTGQAPARQAAMFAGLPTSTICTTINKVCSSGMKAITLAAQLVQTAQQDVVIAGGMESMSNAPFYMKRGTTPFGGVTLHDAILYDGLTDVYNQIHMGDCVENTAKKMGITRKEQDDYAISSYERTSSGWKNNLFAKEIVPVSVPQKKGLPDIVFAEDEEYKRMNLESFRKLPPVFQKEDGTVTAGNASALNDGAAAVLLASRDAVQQFNLKPLARIIGFADGSNEPIDFPIASAVAIPKLLEKTGVKKEEIALWEINEPFSVVALGVQRLLNLDMNKINIHGGAVSMGHPLSMSGARILVHLVHTLKPGEKGVAAVCNGGGGATSVLVERL